MRTRRGALRARLNRRKQDQRPLTVLAQLTAAALWLPAPALTDRSGPPAILPGVSKRAYRRQHQRRPVAPAPGPANRPPTDPERVLLQQIADGALDLHLPALAQAINARLHLLDTVRSVTALAMLNIGDRVRINRHARPRYLHGIQGTILDLDERSATICVHRPVGRFTSGEIRCPPLALDRLNPGT